jgi:hypothetical protein
VEGEKRNRFTKKFVELCQVSIDQVQVCTKRALFRSSRRRISKKHTHRVTEYSVGKIC